MVKCVPLPEISNDAPQVNKRRASVRQIGMGAEEAEKHRRASRMKSDTLVQAQLKALPEYRPIFFEVLCLIQVIVSVYI